MRNEPCKQCGAFDFYIKGDFSYCRPCHSEAQKRYQARKLLGETVQHKPAPSLSLHEQDFKSNYERSKIACVNGHLLRGDNVRVSSQRNGKHLFRRCRTCDRNAKRKTYGLAPEPAAPKLSELLDSLD